MCSISCFPNTCGVGGRKDKWFLLIIQLYECLLSCSVVSNSLQAPWTVACQAPLSMRFSRQEYCSGLPFPSPGDLPNPGVEPGSLESPALAGRFSTTSASWEAAV